jgi:hypothetical protein
MDAVMTSISAALKQCGVTKREIAPNVQAVAIATDQAAEAMAAVAAAADNAGHGSGSVEDGVAKNLRARSTAQHQSYLGSSVIRVGRSGVTGAEAYTNGAGSRRGAGTGRARPRQCFGKLSLSASGSKVGSRGRTRMKSR